MLGAFDELVERVYQPAFSDGACGCGINSVAKDPNPGRIQFGCQSSHAHPLFNPALALRFLRRIKAATRIDTADRKAGICNFYARFVQPSTMEAGKLPERCFAFEKAQFNTAITGAYSDIERLR